MLISEEYKSLNTSLHKTRPAYGKSGHKWKHQVILLCKGIGSNDVTDYGCGKSTLQKALPFRIQEYDPCVHGKDVPPTPTDIVICTDVLEHIEPEYITEVLSDLRRITLRAGLFAIATRPAKKALADGRNAHLIIKDCDWWRLLLSKYFIIDSMIKGKKGEMYIIVRRKE